MDEQLIFGDDVEIHSQKNYFATENYMCKSYENINTKGNRFLYLKISSDSKIKSIDFSNRKYNINNLIDIIVFSKVIYNKDIITCSDNVYLPLFSANWFNFRSIDIFVKFKNNFDEDMYLINAIDFNIIPKILNNYSAIGVVNMLYGDKIILGKFNKDDIVYFYNYIPNNYPLIKKVQILNGDIKLDFYISELEILTLYFQGEEYYVIKIDLSEYDNLDKFLIIIYPNEVYSCIFNALKLKYKKTYF